MKKAFGILLVSALFLLVAMPIVLAKPEKVSATDVELVKKVTVKGPESKGKAKPTNAATGVPIPLGEGKKKYAIIVGISDYPGEENDLRYAHKDAMDMRDALVSVYGFEEDKITLLLNATYNEIRSAVESLKEIVQEGDEVVFFFSGHGARGKADDGDKEAIDEAIVTHDGNQLVFIWDGELRDWFSDFNTTRIVFIFDSCLSGGMTDLKANGRIVVMATTENGIAYEVETLQNGQFTYYFVEEGMIKKKADTTPKDDYVTVEEAFDYAKANCIRQTPTISDSFEKDLLL